MSAETNNEKPGFLDGVRDMLAKLKKFSENPGQALRDELSDLIKRWFGEKEEETEKTRKLWSGIRGAVETDGETEMVKKLGEAISLMKAPEQARRVFGEGPGTELLAKLDEEFGCGRSMITYSFLLIGKVETEFTNPHHNTDPNLASGQINIGMFQLSDKSSKIDAKWDRSFAMGKRIYEQKCGRKLPDDLSMTHKAIIAHVGFIYNERGGAGTLGRIGEARDEATLKGLLINKVQGAVVSMNSRKYGRLINGNELAA